MLLNNHTDREALLDELAHIAPAPALANDIVEWIAQIRESASDKTFPGAVLPIACDDRVIFYAVAGTGIEWRKLAPLLTASIGMTTTTFLGRANQGAEDDSIAQVLRARGFFAVSRFEAYGDPKREKYALQALARLRKQLQGAAGFSRALPRSTSQALYEFRVALATGDLPTAEGIVAYLREGMRMDALNLSFLEVRIDEVFGAWDRLVQRALFSSLCQTRRPPAITAAMVEALYQTAIAGAEQADDPQAALKAFRGRIFERSGTLFMTCPPEPRAAVGKAFLLATLASPMIDRPLIDSLTQVAQSWRPEERRFFERLLTLVPPQPSSERAPVAEEVPRVELPNSRKQLDLAAQEHIPPTPDRAYAVLIAAMDIQTLDASRFAITYVDRLNAAARDELFARPLTQVIWEKLASYGTGNCIPRDWCEWIELLPQMTIAQATTWAEMAVSEHPVEQQLRRQEDVTKLADMLNASPMETQEQLFNALPELVMWIQADSYWPNKAYVALYEQFFELLLLSGNRSPKLYEALSIILSGMLDVGLERAAYSRVLSDLGDMLPELSGSRDLDWLVDLAELVVTYPCPDAAARAGLWSQIISLLAQYGTRVTTPQRTVLTEVAGILGLSDTLAALPTVAAGAGPAPTQRLSLDHRMVGIYTLTEGVGERVGRMLRAEYPDVDVRVNHDPVSTPQLRDLARRADIFVVCWLSAKHAGTDAISQARSQDAITLYARGKGSSSIVREMFLSLEVRGLKPN